MLEPIKRNKKFAGRVGVCLARLGALDAVGQIEEEGGETPLGDHVALEQRRKGRVAERFGQARAEGLARAQVVAQAEVAPDDVLQEADGLRLDELLHHAAQDGPDRVEALVRLADVRQSGLTALAKSQCTVSARTDKEGCAPRRGESFER
jgi:hypothetical protein